MAITKIYKGTNDVTSSFLKAYKGGTEIYTALSSPIITDIAVSKTQSTSQIYGVSGLYQTSTSLTRTDDAVGMSFTINSSNGTIASDFNNVFPWNEATVETINGSKFLHLPDMWFRIGVGGNKSWYKVDSFYYGCYGGSSASTSSPLESVSGRARRHTMTRAGFRNLATLNGAGYFQLDLYHKTVMNFLWLIEWANKNSASIMTGKTSATGKSPVNTGGTDSLTTPSGFNTSTKQMRWHYIEDFVGNFIEFVDGVTGISGDNAYYVTADPSKFSDTTTGLNVLSYSHPVVSTDRCISALGWDNNNPFLVQPIEQIGTDYTVHFCDANGTSNNVALAQGSHYNSTLELYGVFNCLRSAGTASGTTGARLLYKPIA